MTMKSSISDALRKAAQMTRLGQLGEATQLIQTALGRRDWRNGAPESSRADLALDRVCAGPDGGRADRLVLPLGQAIDLLRQRRPRGKVPPRPVPEVRVPQGALFESRTYACAAGTRRYRLFVPSGAPRHCPLLVMLHGCTQGPDDFALGTGMNELAQAERVYVVYPGQDAGANQSGCWNWFNRHDQGRGSSEPRILSGLTSELMREFDCDPHRIFIAGLSAGGAMAAVMGATYPDLYRGLGIHSGLAYGSANDVASAFSTMRGGSTLRPAQRGLADAGRLRTIVFHGSADTTVHPSNGERIIEELQRHLPDRLATVVEGRSAGGRTYRRRLIHDGDATFAEHWLVEGAGHAWSGGHPLGSYTDPAGPDASAEMLRFFLRP
jgi:poly(hydroxyalkanoate) depolymerase family esterase